MSDWFEREEKHLEQLLEAGLITQEEYTREMRELRWALQSEATEAAQQTYDDHMGW